jgi:cardiolipin synthase
MNQLSHLGALSVALHAIIQLLVIIRVLLRPHRQPASRVAWVVLILSVPLLGILIYFLFGETSIGRHRVEKRRKISADLQALALSAGLEAGDQQANPPDKYAHLFQVGKTVSGLNAVSGNRAYLLKDSNQTIDTMVADIDAATNHVHLLFYIWLPDTNGCKIVDALLRAAARGVTCRAIADSLGSRVMIGSKHWQALRRAGVNLAGALPIGNPLLRPLMGRIDLRNHRKIVVIDNQITYCGSQNCADPEFRIKPKYAPWVDAMIRFEGPIALQNQYLFASDWEAETGESIRELLEQPRIVNQHGFVAQAIGTGPTIRYSAMPEIFETLMYTARRELFITTPYYVPDEAMQAGLCAAARRGVETTIIFPAMNDSWVVGAASRSYYADLLSTGVRIFEFEGGLLHTKSLTLDEELTLIGSANMDRRSFDLNYENSILFHDRSLTAEMRQRQGDYLHRSQQVTGEMVEQWTWRQRLWQNTLAMMAPLL